MASLSRSARSDKAAKKPAKPYKDFPLFAHATKRWAKKIRGKFHYFGPWDDPDGALQRYLDQRDDLHSGRTPRVQGDGLTVRELLNRFLTGKQRMVDSGDIVPRTFQDYRIVCERIAGCFGVSRLVSDLASDDFERLRADIAKTRGPTSLANDINRVRITFKYAYDASLIDRPVRFGPNFRKPSKKTIRQVRNDQGERMFEASHIKAMLDEATVSLRAMVLLGSNCGFGNQDCATLPQSALDLDAGWLDYPRPKTAVRRRCPLWPRTIAALRDAIESRPTSKDPVDSDLVFVTSKGLCWAKEKDDNPIAKETRKLLIRLGIHRKGLGFYGLRHGFQTIAEQARDLPAVQAIMGHSADASDMSAVYRERIEDARLLAVTDHVHKWLFGRKPRRRSKPK